MNTKPDLRILFPTSFSDACFRTIRAVAQFADSCNIDLTLAHAVPEHASSNPTARQELHSFFAEADHYSCCHRVVLRGNPLDQISELATTGAYDLVMIPASDRFGVPSWFRSSFRARMLQQCPVPVWTFGGALDNAQIRRQIRTITCLVDFDGGGHPHLRLAAAFASQIGALLRVVHVLEKVDEGTLARFCSAEPPLCGDLAKQQIHSLCSRVAATGAEVDIIVGARRKELCKLLKSCNSDLLFTGPRQVLGSRLPAPRLQPYINRLPCPVVCVDGKAAQFERWSFENAQSDREIASGRKRLAVAM